MEYVYFFLLVKKFFLCIYFSCYTFEIEIHALLNLVLNAVLKIQLRTLQEHIKTFI